MKTALDLAAILAPIPGEDPAGIDLRYSSNLFDEIREARRAEDPLLAAESERDPKLADWGKVIDLSLAALIGKSKDLQVATWLTEALAATDGFAGMSAGMKVLTGLLDNFWDGLYPKIEDDDYDYRAAPFEFLNDRVSGTLTQVPLTDPRITPGHTYLRYLESREVSQAKPGVREGLLADGKLAPEEFDNAVQKSAASFYKTLADHLTEAVKDQVALERAVDEKFGAYAPSLAVLARNLGDLQRLVTRICREQKGLKESIAVRAPECAGEEAMAGGTGCGERAAAAPPPAAGVLTALSGGGDSQEGLIWNEALAILNKKSCKEALDLLLAAANSQSSERARSRYRFLVAKLCLKADRPDLARPIVEQLNTMIGELQLERWECPFWISEIFEALYQCLTLGEDAYDEAGRAKELFQKICTMDVTKALTAGG